MFCAIKKARQLLHKLTSEEQDDVILWARNFPGGSTVDMGYPMRIKCNAPLTDIEDEELWGTSWGLLSCWNHDGALTTEMALHQLANHLVDNGGILPARVQTHLHVINRDSM